MSVAHLADEGSRPGVHGHVPGEVVVRVEHFAALEACERLAGVLGAAVGGRRRGHAHLPRLKLA